MKKLFIITFALLASISFGQTATKKDNISSGDGSNTVGNTSIIYTVEEVVVQENTVENVYISEGFISPDLLQAFSVEEYTELQGVNIFPNPATKVINVQFNEESDYPIVLTNM